MSAKPADKWLPQQRIFQESLLKIETLQTIKLNWNMPINSKFYSLHCNSCARYAVVMYHSINLTSWKMHVSYTHDSGELIQTWTEQLQNRRIFIYFPYCKFIFYLGSFLNYLSKLVYKSTFSNWLVRKFKSTLTVSTSLRYLFQLLIQSVTLKVNIYSVCVPS